MSDFIINKTIRIVSTFNNDKSNASQQALISYAIHHPVESRIPLATGHLIGTDAISINIKGADHFIIQGQLNTQLTSHEILLSANLFYGFSGNMALQSHFEGTIAIYPLQVPVPPPPSE